MTISLRSLVRRTDDFIFGPVDARVCAWLRIGFGFLMLINFAVMALDFERWFGEAGAVPYETARRAIDPDTWTLFTLLPRSGPGLLLCAVVMLVQAFMLMIGWLSRFNAACVFLWLLSLQHRNHLLFDGEDLLFRLFAFFLIFLPIGTCWSVDAWQRHRSGKAPPPPGSRWPLRLIQAQLALIYLSSAWEKLDGAEWLDGSALWYVIHLDDSFGRMPLPSFVAESLMILRLAGWAVILAEVFLVFGPFFRETRLLAIAVGFGLHLTLELTMNLFLFAWVMMLTLTSHLSGAEIEAVLGRVAKIFRRSRSGEAGDPVDRAT